MDPETNLPDLTDDLSLEIDDLTTALSPLLSSPLHTLTATLPTLDKAKLHILTAYALESLLFQALQASGANAKSHPIFAELARLKTYFAKVKTAEQAGEGKGAPAPTTKLDKGAAARFIRHGLAGNERFDREREERVAREKARAALKARAVAERVNKRFDEGEEERVQARLGEKRKAEAKEENNSSEDDDEEDEVLTGLEEPGGADALASGEDHVDSENAEFYGEAKDDDDSMDVDPTAHVDTPGSKKSKRDKKSNKRRKSDMNATASDSNTPSTRKTKGKKDEYIIPERGEAPRTRSETFTALLSGSLAEQKEKKGGKGKGKKAKKA